MFKWILVKKKSLLNWIVEREMWFIRVQVTLVQDWMYPVVEPKQFANEN